MYRPKSWNYVVVHAYGRPATFEGVERLRSHLSALTKQFEDELPEPWTIDDAPADFIDGLCQGIVGIEIQISRLEGKWKLSQNHPAEDQMGIAEGLKGRSGDAHNQLAALINRKS